MTAALALSATAGNARVPAQPANQPEAAAPSSWLAEDLSLSAAIARLKELRSLPQPATILTTIEVIQLERQLDHSLLKAQLEIEDVLSEIDDETARVNEMSYSLQSRRDRSVRLNSLANLLGTGGLGLVASGIGVSDSSVGNIVGLTSSGVNTGLAAASFTQQRFEKAFLTRMPTKPNLLAPMFGLEVANGPHFPPVVWNYLNHPRTVDGKQTRRDELIARWKRQGRIGDINDPVNRNALDVITGASGSLHKLTMQTLANRSAMLSDLRAVVLSMSKSVLKLLYSSETASSEAD